MPDSLQNIKHGLPPLRLAARMPSHARQDDVDDESVPIGKAPKQHLHMRRRRSSRLVVAAAEPWDHRWGMLPGAAPGGVTVTEAASAMRESWAPRPAAAAPEEQQQQQQQQQQEPEVATLRRHFSRPPPSTARKFAEAAPLGEVIGPLPPPLSHRAQGRGQPTVAEWEGTMFHAPPQELRATLSRGSADSDSDSESPPAAGAETPVADADLPGWMPRPLVQQRKVCLSRDAMPVPLPEASTSSAAVTDPLSAAALLLSPAAAPPAVALVDHRRVHRFMPSSGKLGVITYPTNFG